MLLSRGSTTAPDEDRAELAPARSCPVHVLYTVTLAAGMDPADEATLNAIPWQLEVFAALPTTDGGVGTPVPIGFGRGHLVDVQSSWGLLFDMQDRPASTALETVLAALVRSPGVMELGSACSVTAVRSGTVAMLDFVRLDPAWSGLGLEPLLLQAAGSMLSPELRGFAAWGRHVESAFDMGASAAHVRYTSRDDRRSRLLRAGYRQAGFEKQEGSDAVLVKVCSPVERSGVHAVVREQLTRFPVTATMRDWVAVSAYLMG